MDIKEVASRLGLEEEDIYNVLELFIQTSPVDLATMSSAFEKRDMSLLGKLAHSLKGSTGTLGFMEISNLAQQITVQSRENKLEDLNWTVPTFIGQMNDLISQIEKRIKRS